MSGALSPLADLSIEEAEKYRGNLLRSIAGGTLSVRTADGSQVTYRSHAEMKDALRLLEVAIGAATNPPVAVTRQSRFYFSTSKGL